MAIFKSTLLSDVRGALNGSVFSRTRAGNIIRNRTQPVQPNTAEQSAQRSYMQQATDLFKAEDVATIEAWQEAISLSGFTAQNALGDSYVPSAKQVYTMCALNLTKHALGAPTAPSLAKFIANPNLPGISYGVIGISTTIGPPAVLSTFDITSVSTSVPGFMQVAATLPLLPTIRNYKKYLRVIGSVATVVAPTSESIAGIYGSYFPTVDWDESEGLIINLAIRAFDPETGLAGAWLYIGGIEVPAPS